jgi:small subunit ribosomal protein S6
VRRYETTFISHADLPDEDLERLSKRASDMIQQRGGEIFQVQQWGKKKLAYKVKKQPRGSYTLLDYTVSGNAVQELERILRLDDKVLKFLTVLVDEEVDVEAVREHLAQGQRAKALPEEEVPEVPAPAEAEGAAATESPEATTGGDVPEQPAQE